MLAAKQATVPEGAAQWDYIGELQSRKVKDLVPQVSRIHTLASASAVRRLQALAAEGVAIPELLVQVNVAGEGARAASHRLSSPRSSMPPRACPSAA